MSSEHLENASREDLLAEISRLERMVAAYEQVNAYSERELVKANRILAAYQETQELSPGEIVQLKQQMQRGLRQPGSEELADPERATPDALQQQIRAAIEEGLTASPGKTRATEVQFSAAFERLQALRHAVGPRFYTEFFRLMIHQEFVQREAQVYWDDIVDHTTFLTQAFGRPISFRVAMLDYFLQRSPVLRNPRFIEMHTYDEMVRTSLQDELTGLYNRRFLDRCLLQEFHRAKRHKHPVAILIFDIDNFKTYNDSFGHPAGDEVMRTIGGLMTATFREEDQACRYGGEEFVVVLPETNAERAVQVADRFMTAVRETEFPHRAITMSGGAAAYPEHGDAPGQVFLVADQALYQAKHAGKDRIVRADG